MTAMFSSKMTMAVLLNPMGTAQKTTEILADGTIAVSARTKSMVNLENRDMHQNL